MTTRKRKIYCAVLAARGEGGKHGRKGQKGNAGKKCPELLK